MPDKQPSGLLARHVIDAIRRQNPNHDLTKIIENALGLSSAAAYRRLRGEVSFSADELVKLASAFHIPLDAAVFQGTGMIPVWFPAEGRALESPVAFLARVETQLKQVISLPGANLWYTSTEVPFFQYMRYPELTAFKLYMWNKTTWKLPAYNQAEFSPEIFGQDPLMEQHRQSILQLYAQLPSHEFWSVQILENTLSQIRYTAYENKFTDKKTATLLVDQIAAMIDDWERMAQQGRKIIEGCPVDKPTAFELYQNEIMHTSNLFYVDSSVKKIVFFTFDNPNYLMTDDPWFCDYAQNWVEKVRRLSQKISVDGEKNRKVFFDALRRRVAGWETM